jgi:hypothetical protein
MVGWVFFRAGTPTEAVGILRALFLLGRGSSTFNPAAIALNPVAAYLALAGLIYCFFLEGESFSELTQDSFPPWRQVAAAGQLMLSLIFGFSQFTIPFLYFQF